MSDRPVDLQTLFRRALAAQMDMGVGEIIVQAKQPTEAITARTINAAFQPRVMAVQEAVTAQPSSESDPADMFPKVLAEPEYESLEAHREAICNCRKCPLHKTRNKFVYGIGNPNADLMFVGEAPGADEDRIGKPFVGRAGQLLDKIIAAMGLDRTKVYIANILKSRPPGNRDPLPEEVELCIPYLKEQIRIIRPKLMVALGRIAVQALLDTKTPLGKLRGKWHEFETIPLYATYHPAALLRFPQYKRDTWADMQVVMARLKEEIS